MSDLIDDAIARAAAEITSGAAGAALAGMAALLKAHPADARVHIQAARALLAAADQTNAYAALDDAAKDRLYRRLLLQPDCPARPFILHHEVAAQLTSQSAAGVPRLVAELAPTLTALLAEGEPAKPLLLFLLVAREHLGGVITQARLSALHLRGFPAFEERDLALPYSTVFHEAAFGRNRDDLLGAMAADGAGFLARLKPRHVPLIAWLNGGRMPPIGADHLATWLAASMPPDDDDRAGARAIVLATAIDTALIDPPARVALGLDDATLAEADRLARARTALGVSDRAADRAAARLRSRPWMAARALRSIAARHAPFIARGDRRVKVAICVSGQLRGYRTALAHWRRTIIGQADVQFFVHSWRMIGRGPAQPWRVVLPFSGARFTEAYRRLAMQEGLPAFEERYPALYRALGESATVTADDLRAAYRTPHAIVDDERDVPFAGFTNPEKMHYKIWAAHQLAMASGGTFDLVVRIRPDLATGLAAFDWRDLRDACRGARLFADNRLGVHHGLPMMGDQLAIAAPATMRSYADTWLDYPRVAALGVSGARRDFVGHTSLAHTCWLNGIGVRRAPIKNGRLVEPAPFESAAILQALDIDAGARLDAIDRELIAAARADLAG